MRVGVLGPIVVDSGDVTTSPRGQRPRDLLAALLQRRGRPVAPDVLLDLVWGDAAVGLTPAVVHTVVARLRRHLGAQLVATHETGYLVPASTPTDEDDFVAAHDEATRAAGAGDPVGAAAAYRKALRLWRAEVPYDGVRDELVAADRARLVETQAGVQEALVAVLLEHPAAGAPDEALRRALELCARWPLREHPHRLAMTAAYHGGRQAQALELYGHLRSRLRRELGVDPAPATTALHARVLAHELDLRSPADAALAHGAAPAAAGAARSPTRRSNRRVSTVPVPAAPIVGRSAELAAIRADLDSGHRLITVHGPGGVGKTRLLREVGRHLAGAAHPDSTVVYVDLAGVDARSDADLALTVLSAAGLPIGEDDPVDSVVAAIGAGPTTLLVDEAEWSLEVVVPVLARVLAQCPGTRVVVTSRVPLDLVGERGLLLSPLACPPDRADAAGIRRAPAVALLLERLRDHAPDLELGDGDMALVAGIARRVDGLPLALEILAGHAGTRSLDDLVGLSQAPLDVPAGGRDRGPRHQSLRETIAWSTARLAPQAQLAQRRLGVFAGSFDAAAAAAVTGLDGPTADTCLRALVREGLLQVDRRDGSSAIRYRMLRTVRDLALDALADSAELAGCRARHRAWFAAAWRARPRSDDLILDVRDRHDDFLQALRSALDTRDHSGLGDLAMTLSRYWLFSHWTRPAIGWLTRVLDSGVLDPVEQARIRLQRACLALNVDPELTRDDVARALPVIETAGDLITLVTGHGTAALAAAARDDLTTALEHARRSVQAARQTTPERTADALGMLAVVQSALDDTDGVLATAAETLDILERAGSAVARIAVCTNIGVALAEVGRPAEALAALDRAAAGLDHTLGEAPAYFDLARGWALLHGGSAEPALQAFTRVLDALPDGTVDPTAVETYAGLAAALATLGRPGAAAACADAETLTRRMPGAVTAQQRALLLRLAGPGHPGQGTAAGDRSAAAPVLTATLRNHLWSLLGRSDGPEHACG